MTMTKGQIRTDVANIFPIIKKFLYSDHEIFLRELVANATDATQKLKTYADKGEAVGQLDDLKIEVSIDEAAKTLTISDKGVGMSEEELDRFINQIAFSGAHEFLEKFKEDSAIIGHFGLGFYSSFMVADKVEIQTKSYKDDKPVHWSCEGDPEFEMGEGTRTERGTDIILHINEESAEFLKEARVQELLTKYCKFLPIEIKFGENEVTEKGEGEDAVETVEIVENIINNTQPAWMKKPAKLSDDDYRAFYRELYPGTFDDPLFWIHLNVDFPFHLTGILYFPKLKNNFEVKKNKISLYSNQVFVTDNVENIVPEFLMLLQGVIDSPDIPLNVSRSYLQSDPNVKQISEHITKKVSQKLAKLFKKDRENFESKWTDIGVFIKYGMLTDEKFADKAKGFGLLEDVDGKFFTSEEYKESIKATQTDKNEKVVILYSSDLKAQDAYLREIKDKGLSVLKMDHEIDTHFVGWLEQNLEGVQFKRVDADVADKLIETGEDLESVLSEDQQTKIKDLFTEELTGSSAMVELKALSPEAAPVMITKNEIMRRYQEMSKYNGMDMGGFPESYNFVVNTNHPMMEKILKKQIENRKKLVNQLHDLALLQQNMLSGSGLTDFIKRSMDLMA